MTDEVVRVIETIVMLSLVILAGLLSRKFKLLDGRATEKLSAFVIDVARGPVHLPERRFPAPRLALAPQDGCDRSVGRQGFRVLLPPAGLRSTAKHRFEVPLHRLRFRLRLAIQQRPKEY